MHDQIEKAIVIYCIIDEALKALKHKDDIRAIFSDTEILLIAIRRLKRLDNLYFLIFNLI